MPMPVPTATPEPGTASQEEVDKLLEELDANSIIEDAIAAIEENPIFRAVRTQTLYDGGTEIFDAIFEYTGDSDAPFTAQGTHTTPSIGRIYEYDSTWRSTCIRAIAPSVGSWLYYEHDEWLKTEDNAEILVPAIPFYSLFIDSLFVDALFPYDVEWEAFDLHRRSGPLELVLRTVIFDVIGNTTVILDVLGYTAHIHPEEHPSRVVIEKSYLFDQLSSETTYSYDIVEGPALHESKEDCLSRNSG